MRLLCWNVRDLLGDPLAVHRVVRAAAPDVVCLQEAPRRPGAWLRLRFLERGFGLRCVAGGRRSGGTAIFVSDHLAVEWARALRLPVTGRSTRTRGTAVADLNGPDLGQVTVASVHLPLKADLRAEHARMVRSLLDRRGRAGVVVAGDFNEPAGSPAWRAWAPLAGDPWPDAGPTFPAHDPVSRIDGVLVSTGLRADCLDAAWNLADVRLASDHLPVLAVIAPSRSFSQRWGM
jgi:endonuclease/exonuclease/phosphatase family metal-dependent hydrolase